VPVTSRYKLREKRITGRKKKKLKIRMENEKKETTVRNGQENGMK
jgi:hypothetical protein